MTETTATRELAAGTAATAVLYLRVNRMAVGSLVAAEAQAAWQRQACGAVAARLGVQVVREYCDHGGAVRLSRRPELGRLLDELAERQDLTLVIASDRQRLARNGRDMTEIERRVTAAGARVVTAEEPNEYGAGDSARAAASAWWLLAESQADDSLAANPLFGNESGTPFSGRRAERLNREARRVIEL